MRIKCRTFLPVCWLVVTLVYLSVYFQRFQSISVDNAAGHIEDHQNSLHHLKILQFMERPLADGLVMSLTCTASLSRLTHNLMSGFDITWSGIGIDQKSMWLHRSNTTRHGNSVANKLVFRPLLTSHAGEYICYLVKNNEVVDSKSITVSDTFRGLINSRTFHHSVNSEKQFKPGMWFPTTGMCGGEKIWQEYAKFHSTILSEKRKGKYVIYSCTNRPCGGFGSRIQAISSALIFAMLTRRVLLVRMTYPIDFNTFVFPNAIQWNADIPSGLSIKQLYLIHSENYYHHYKEFEASMLNSDIDVVEVQMNFGLFFHLVSTDVNLINKIVSTFNLRSHHDLVTLYSCAFKYLFNYMPETLEEIQSTQSKLGLLDGKYVSLHVRSHLSDGVLPNPLYRKFSWSKMFKCAVLAAQTLKKKLNISNVPIFLATDHNHVINYAKEFYSDKVILSQAPMYHIDDHIEKKHMFNNDELGLTGILSDIEISARAGVLIQSSGSTLSELIGSIAYFYNINHILHPFYFYQNSSYCNIV